MKRQYLGDAKDAFKWDYLDFLTRELRIQLLNILLMLTPNKDNGEGKMSPELFPASREILRFCMKLRKVRWGPDSKIMRLLRALPEWTGANYAVELHKESACFQDACVNGRRAEYFSRLADCDAPQVVFIDPDTGFSPEKLPDAAYVSAPDVESVLDEITNNSIVIIFQHRDRNPVELQFGKIKDALSSFHSMCFYCGHLMFFAVCADRQKISQICKISRKYEEMVIQRRREQGRTPLKSGVIPH